jgi:hypothetical protein
MADWTAAAEDSDGQGQRDDLRAQIIDILIEAHRDFAGGQRVTHSKSNRPYGTIYGDLPERLCAGLARVRNDVEVRKVGRAGYPIPVIRGVRYFPWRPPGGVRPDKAVFDVSGSREQLWRQRWNQDALPFNDPDDELVVDRGIAAETGEGVTELLRDQERVVVVAMTSNPAGVTCIEWAEATLSFDGRLVWEPVVIWSGDEDARPTEVNARPFDAGIVPTPGVRPRPIEESHTVERDGASRRVLDA